MGLQSQSYTPVVHHHHHYHHQKTAKTSIRKTEMVDFLLYHMLV